jgi:pseudouridine synthase
LSQAGIASRRAAEQLIRDGRVEVNGVVVTTLGEKADPAGDEIRVDGRRLPRPAQRRYLLLYKPRGVVSTRTDPQRRPTVVDLARRAGIDEYLYPVGRLDYDSEGLMILTNDGAFAERVMHPRYELPRTYEVEVAGVPDERDLARLRRGIVIDGRRTRAARVRLLRTLHRGKEPTTLIEITIHEGRNRQVRRMADAIAHPVERLRRVRLGSLAIGSLAPGEIRDLTERERKALLSPESPGGHPRSARSS